MSDRIRSGGSAVQEDSGSNLLVPEGEALFEQIAAGARDGRPAWRIYSKFVPRLAFVAGSTRRRIVPAMVFGIPREVPRVSNAVAAAVARAGAWPENAHARAQLRCLSTAAARDIANIDPPTSRVSTTIDRDRRLGREMWAALGAWPWSLFGPAGKLPDDWRRDEFVIVAWRDWLDGRALT
jgi:hypothetical protein